MEQEKCPHCGIRTDHGHDPNRCDPHAALVGALRDCLANLQMECPECEGCKTDLCVQCRAKAALKLAQADEFKPERKGGSG